MGGIVRFALTFNRAWQTLLGFMHRIHTSWIGLVALALAACKPDPEVTTYTVPKEATAERPMPPGMAPAADSPTTPTAGPMTPPMTGGGMTATPAMAAQVSGFATPAWQAPADWQAKPLGSVRKGSWDVTGDGGSADMSVTVFPGDVGGDLANVNRWLRQIQMPPVDEQGLQGLMQHIDMPGGVHAHVVYLKGESGQSILGAIVPHDGATWFFKMQGDSALIGAQNIAFLDFLHTVEYSTPAH